MNCADNTGAKNLYVISVTGTGARLNRLPAAGRTRCFHLIFQLLAICSLLPSRRESPNFVRRVFLCPLVFDSLVMPAIVVRQRKAWRRKNGVFLYFEGLFWQFG